MVLGATWPARRQLAKAAVRSRRCGFMLAELLMGLSTTAMLAVVLGGLMLAVQRADEHTSGLQDATIQARAALERMRYMISQAAVQQLAGQPSRPGLAVVEHRWAVVDLPDVLVVWSGGRQGGLAELGPLSRNPAVSELIVYAADPEDPHRLVEFAFPSATGTIDFEGSSFAQSIRDLLTSSAAEKIVLCDRLRVSPLPGFAWYSAAEPANLRFSVEHSPDDAALAGVTPGSSAWYALPWSQGAVSRESGLRQTRVRVELQVLARATSGQFEADPDTSIPFFDSVSVQYVYQP